MNRRILSALTGATLLGGVLAANVAMPRTVAAAQCSQPHVSSVTNALAHRDESVTVSGSGFTCGGRGNGTSLTVGGSGQNITGLADNSITFQASGAAGSVVVTVSYPVLLGSQSQSSNTERLLLMAPAAAQNTANPGPGGGFTVSGSGFTMGGFAKGITASACGQGLAVGPYSDTAVPISAPGSYCNGGVSLGITGYATSTRNATILTNTVGLDAGAINVAPSPGGLSTSAAAPGQVVSFSGAGYGNSGSATLNGVGIASAWNDNTISFTVQPASTSGAVMFTRGDGRQIPAGNLTVNSQIAGPTSARAQAGDTVTINGAGFGPGGTVTLGGTALGIKSWSPTSIAVTIPAGASGGDLTVTPQGTAPSTLPNGLAILRLGGLKPANGAAGSTIGITGGGFGSQKGSVTIAGVNAPVQLWGDGTIAVVVPSIPRFAGGGDDHITVNVPGAASPLTAAFHIDPTPASTPGSTPGNTPGDPTGTAAPNTNTPGFIPPSGDGPLIQIGPVPFHKTPKVAGPVDLALKSDQSAADPGVNIPFTVSLSAFGNPVVGAPVDLLLVVVPGGDASISPAKGVTDASGRVSGVLHLSKRAGDHIILARSGQYSDEIKVTGRGLVSTGGAGGTDSGLGNVGGSSPQRTIIVAALLACLVLFLSGFGINLATARNPSAAAAATATPRRRVAGSLVAVPVNAGAAAQFGLAMMVCTVGQLVALARRR
ncbi:MAG TPA: IPT/TIG domain-containing protein [Candidatus Dormibacteraeota bacterium]|nr:IPT/TIG domain-containing protein [Candidatus Dormibacteraeota bacterium]